MSNVDIWGSSTTKHSTTGAASPPHVTLTNYIRKTGDVMMGILNMHNNRIENLSRPQADSDAATKRYVKNRVDYCIQNCNETKLAIGGNSGIIGTLKLGTLDDKDVDIVRNNVSCISISENITINRSVDVNGRGLFNLRSPLSDSEAVNRRYVQTLDATAIHKDGDNGPLNIGSKDNSDVTFSRNGLPYLSLGGNIVLHKILDINRKPIVNVGLPTHDDDCSSKRYVDQSVASSSKANKDLIDNLNTIICRDTDGAVSFKQNTESYIKLDSSSVTLEKDLVLGNECRIRNLSTPTTPSEPTTKQYVDTTTLHRGGDRGSVGGLVIGSQDSIPVFLIMHNDIYMALIDDMIDFRNKKLTNISTPVNDFDVCSKKYTDDAVSRSRLNRNHVGYIPENPVPYGFAITASSQRDDAHSIMNILKSDSSSWISQESPTSFFTLTCPDSVKVWKIRIECFITKTSSQEVSLSLQGSHDGNEWVDIPEVEGEGFSQPAGGRYEPPKNNYFIATDAYKYYKNTISCATNVTFEVTLFQMYVYNS